MSYPHFFKKIRKNQLTKKRAGAGDFSKVN